MKGLIEQFAIKCDCCMDGLQALQLVKDRAASPHPMYKLILMDFSMPLCDGPSSTSQIRSFLSARENQEQPFIAFLTAFSEEQYQ